MKTRQPTSLEKKIAEEATDIFKNTKTNKKKAEAASRALRKALGQVEKTEVFWVKSLTEGAKLAAQMTAGRKKVSKEEIKKAFKMIGFGSIDHDTMIDWLCFKANSKEARKDPVLNAAIEFKKQVGFTFDFKDAVILVPKAIISDTKRNKSGDLVEASLNFEDGTTTLLRKKGKNELYSEKSLVA